MSNFICNNCGEEIHIQRFSMKYDKDENQTKFFEGKKQIVCKNCNEVMKMITEKVEKIEVSFGKFSSLNPEGKKEYLLKRSKQHANTPEQKQRRQNLLDTSIPVKKKIK